VRGGFGDPRTLFRLSSPDDLTAKGSFSFHNGVDISAAPDTPVYPVISGVADAVYPTEVDVRTQDGRLFRYQHVLPSVGAGDPVVKDETILGTVDRLAKHVHLSETRDGRNTNPLAPGHLTPWTDDTTPQVASILFRDAAGNPVDARDLTGQVQIDAARVRLAAAARPRPLVRDADRARARDVAARGARRDPRRFRSGSRPTSATRSPIRISSGRSTRTGPTRTSRRSACTTSRRRPAASSST